MSAFTEHSLNAEVGEVLEVNLDSIVGPGNLRSQVFGLLTWLEANDKVDVFLAAATRNNPGNKALRAFVASRSEPVRPQKVSAVAIAQTVLESGLSRSLLLSGVNSNYRMTLERGYMSSLEQVVHDVDAMQHTGKLLDGSNPWRTWLENAVCGTRGQRSNELFCQLLHEEVMGGRVDRDLVYIHLCEMLPSQLGTVAFRMGIPHAYLPGPGSPPATIASAMIQWAEANGRLSELATKQP